MPNSKRIYYLDWIRVFIVLTLIPFHSAVSFSHIGKAYVYTSEPVNSFLYLFISDFFNLWFMRTLFFISGIAAYYSLKSKRKFVTSKIKRLLIPVAFTLFIIGPLSGYFIYLEELPNTLKPEILKFYISFFTNPTKYLFWGHMWYCIYLFTFSLTLLPVLSFLKNNTRLIKAISEWFSRGLNILLPALFIVVLEYFLRPHYPGYQKLIGDWANVAVYSGFFLLGFIIGDKENLYNKTSSLFILFFTLALFSTTIFIGIKRGEHFTDIHGIQNILWGISAYSWTMTLIGFSKKCLNFRNSLLDYLNQISFSIYIFHYLIVSVFNWIILKVNMHHIFKWFFSILLSFLTLIILYEIVIKKIKILRFVCGLK